MARGLQQEMPSLSYLGTDLGPDASIWITQQDRNARLYGNNTQRLTHCYIGSIPDVVGEEYLEQLVLRLIEVVDKSPHAAISVSYGSPFAIHVPVRWIRSRVPGTSNESAPRLEVILPVKEPGAVPQWMNAMHRRTLRRITDFGSPLNGFLTVPIAIDTLEPPLRARRLMQFLMVPDYTVIYRSVSS